MYVYSYVNVELSFGLSVNYKMDIIVLAKLDGMNERWQPFLLTEIMTQIVSEAY